MQLPDWRMTGIDCSANMQSQQSQAQTIQQASPRTGVLLRAEATTGRTYVLVPHFVCGGRDGGATVWVSQSAPQPKFHICTYYALYLYTVRTKLYPTNTLLVNKRTPYPPTLALHLPYTRTRLLMPPCACLRLLVCLLTRSLACMCYMCPYARRCPYPACPPGKT